MSDQQFAEIATESELRDFAAKIYKQCKVIRKAEAHFDSAHTAEKEAKETLKRLGDEKNTLIEEMDEEPKAEQAKAIKDKRFEEMRAEIDASAKNTDKNEAKHTFAKEEKLLREMIDESNDDQQRMDFDKATRAKELVELPGEKTGDAPDSTEGVKEWRNVNITKLDIPKGMVTPLNEIGVVDLGTLQSLVFGDMEGYENGPSSIPNWGVGKVQKLMDAIHGYMDEHGIEDFETEPSDEEPDTIPMTLEDQFTPIETNSDEVYEDVDDDNESGTDVFDDNSEEVEVRIKSMNEDSGTGLTVGDIVTGVKTGGVVKVRNNEGNLTLMPHEYEMVS